MLVGFVRILSRCGMDRVPKRWVSSAPSELDCFVRAVDLALCVQSDAAVDAAPVCSASEGV